MESYYRTHGLVPDTRPVLQGSNESNSFHDYSKEASFDTNMIIILAALLYGLICALGLNSIVKCVLRCRWRFFFESVNARAERLAATRLKKSMLRRIPVAVYGSGIHILATDYPIFLGEFMDGEKLRVLPRCHHGFHVRCIDIWLALHSSCPTCRQSLLEQPVMTSAEDAGDIEAGLRQPRTSSAEEVG